MVSRAKNISFDSDHAIKRRCFFTIDLPYVWPRFHDWYMSVYRHIKLQWTVAFMHVPCTHTPTLRKPSFFQCFGSPLGYKPFQWVPLNKYAPQCRHHFTWSPILYIISISPGWRFQISPLHTLRPAAHFWFFLPFIHDFEPFMKSASMIMIKRTPQHVRLSDPAMPAPPGMRSNFVNPSDLKTEGLILIIFCLTASIFVVSMRMWTKIRVLHKVFLEDCDSTFFRLSLVNLRYWPFQGFVVSPW